ncbi:MAG: sugar transferase [Candidatus Omnitrophica bacterium]|nr:sugar transferase [Candidatus Omnitrophota bacterium]
MTRSFKIYPFYIIADMILAAIIFCFSYLLRYNLVSFAPFVYKKPYLEQYVLIFALWLLLIIFFFRKNRLYTTNRGLSIPKEIGKVILSLTYTVILISAAVFLLQYKFFSRKIIAESFFALCVSLSAWRAVKRTMLRRMIARGLRNINILIVGANETGRIIAEETKLIPWLGFKAIGYLDNHKEGYVDGIPVLGKIKDFFGVAKNNFVDEVIIAVTSESKEIVELIEQAKNLHLGIRKVVSSDPEASLVSGRLSYFGTTPLFTYSAKQYNLNGIIFKRIFDITTALIFIILLLPLFVIIAVLIKLDSPGPAIYTQERIGVKGGIFKLYKFRSMIKGADTLQEALLTKNEAKDGIIFKIRNDPRITTVGYFIRKYSLDELPQLFNVLCGEMSIVGPRPPLPNEVKKYKYYHLDRLQVKPGMTGLSQIRGRSELTFRKLVKWDLWYINNWSLRLDLNILFWTLPAILKGRGAY